MTHVFDKFSKRTKNSKKKQRNPKKIYFWYIYIIFSIFNTISKEFKFSKVFWTRSTFNALILQSLIFLVESTLILIAFKNTKKIWKIKIYQKKRKGKVEGPIWKQHFAYKYQATVQKKEREKIERHGGGENFGGEKVKTLT